MSAERWSLVGSIRSRTPTGRRAAWILGLWVAGSYVAALTLIVRQLRDPALEPFEFWIEGTFSGPIIGLIAVVLVARRPDHRISRLFALLAAAGSLQTLSGAGATTLLQTDHTGLGAYLAWIHELAQFTLVVVLVLIVALFPTGSLPSPRWRPVAWWLVGGWSFTLTATALSPGTLGNFPRVANPLAIDIPGLGVLYDVGTWAVLAGFVAAVLGTVVRFGRARGPERQQLKWFVFAVAAAACTLGLIEPLLPGELASAVLWTIAPAGVVAVIGLTVLRYRLYDIDRVVSRTVTYATATVVLAGIYVVGVIGLGTLLRTLTGGTSGDLVVVASTLAVVAAFRPVTAKVRHTVDRQFDRSRYDARRTVERFTRGLRDEVDLDALTNDLAEAAKSALRPAHTSVWLAAAPTGRALAATTRSSGNVSGSRDHQPRGVEPGPQPRDKTVPR